MHLPGKFILLAEDDPCVAELVLHVLRQQPEPPRIVHVRDGVEALDFLYQRETFQGREPGNPTVVLLDLKMPRIDGLEVLRHVKNDGALRATPVVMLTSSQDERDIRASYELGANAYVVKPVEFRRLVEVLGHLESFWMEINHVPPDDSGRVAVAAPR
ncbi:response regulator [Opitutus sp. ER46]|uniref:response regulator n=1 Tax=Opitutus sp. ER46 TaxID=2161864 RepID=UPI000D30673F|nr:response regulator [Opitutus sp. ER46]PTX92713.1 two-component system response regulator [Opitutus sp. ER46]